MKTKPHCIVCAFRQVLNTGRIASADPRVRLACVARLVERLHCPTMDQAPAALCRHVYQAVSEVTGIRDPYARIKRVTNRAAQKLLPELEALVDRARDPLKAACHLAIAGNIIDLGIGHGFSLERDVKSILRRKLAIDDYPAFRRELRPGCRALYIGDNSGEIVFDRVLVEHLLQAGAHVTFVVKSRPVINDATLADARFCGLTKLVPVVPTGSDDIGIHWDHVGKPFLRAFRTADLVIAKGHGNFETCVGHSGNFYFLLKAKCEMVAEELGIPLHSLVFKHSHNRASGTAPRVRA